MARESGPVDKGDLPALLNEHIVKPANSGVLTLEPESKSQSTEKQHLPMNTLIVDLTFHDCEMECCLCFMFVNLNSWQIHEYTNHDSSVNSVQWAPHDFGLVSSIVVHCS